MRILGIDIGSSSIKAVEMNSSFGRFEIYDYYERLITEGVTTQEAIAQLIREIPREPDRIIIGLGKGRSTFRNLQLPSKDKKAIQSGIGFELEDDLPFPLDHAVFDYAVISQSKQGSQIHVAATLKRAIQSELDSLKNTGLDPDVITPEAWAYRNLMNRILGNPSQDAPVLLAQIGHERTTLYLHWKGAPAHIRELNFGGREITSALSKHYQISLEQAEVMKIDQGFLSTPDPLFDIGPDQLELAQTIESPLQALIIELKQIDLICRSITHHTVSSIFLAGGTSLLPGLSVTLSEATRTPCQCLKALSTLATSGVTYSEQTDAKFLLAAALAYSQVGSQRSTCINLRKGEFQKVIKSRELNFQVLRRPLIAAAVVSFCLFLSLTVQTAIYKEQLTSLDSQLEKSVKSFFGGNISSSGLRTYLSNASVLRSSISKEITKQKGFVKLFGPNPHSPLDYLNHLSQTIGKDTVIDVTHFQVGNGPNDPFSAENLPQLSMTALASNPQTIEKLNSILSAKVTQLQKGKVEESVAPSDSGVKKWKISYTGKTSEDTYGR